MNKLVGFVRWARALWRPAILALWRDLADRQGAAVSLHTWLLIAVLFTVLLFISGGEDSVEGLAYNDRTGVRHLLVFPGTTYSMLSQLYYSTYGDTVLLIKANPRHQTRHLEPPVFIVVPLR